MARLSRRVLLRSGAAAGVLAATGMPLRAAPKRGGRLRAGLGGADRSDSWDARRHSGLFMAACGHGAVFDTLTMTAAGGSLVGELAESWESADAKTWTFNLRKGVTFHNGKAFGADDVIASLRLHTEQGANSAAGPIVASISEMRKITEHQVQFTLATGNADFPYLMSDYHLLIYPAGQIEEAIAGGIGTGLYQVHSFQPGVRMVARRYANHYKCDSAGFFDEIEYVAMNDGAVRLNALLAGEVDAIDQVDPRAEATLRANPALRIQEVTGNRHLAFPMMSATPPFDDVNLRRALKYAVNRREMVDGVLCGHGRVGNDTPIGPANQYHAGDLEQLEFDADRARFHMRAAGVTSLDIDLCVSDAAFVGASDAARLFQASARQAGININVVEARAEAYWSGVWRRQPFCAGHWSGRATEDWMFATAYGAGAPWNDTQWDHARFAALLSSARGELDGEARRAQYREMQEILRVDGAVIVPMFANFVQAVSNRVVSPERIGNLWAMDNARMAERWWMA